MSSVTVIRMNANAARRGVSVTGGEDCTTGTRKTQLSAEGRT
jgi:hypothetical protein